ncbi:hypothetical protein GCM10009839_47640 [Catenulispora yoronensis]|uniref:DUF2567 domain-containing protein n=1 Tax=Catenulispora yoronensis TaxID=450799 RepID=A0ABN2UMB3_9ACTN
MNDQTSPTAGGQGPGSPAARNPFHEPQSGQGLPGVPRFDDRKGGRPGLRTLLRDWRADLLAGGILLTVGVLLGVLAGMAWYRFAPTVWLTIPADAVPQVKAGIDQSALLVAPEAKGIASVDGYYFLFTAAAGLLLGVLGFWLGRRGFLAGRDRLGQRDGAGVGAWVGVLLGSLAASTLAAALGRWISMPDPLVLLHTIAAGHNFHAPVALHAQGLYLAGPALGTVLFLALTAAFTKPSPPPWQSYEQRSPVFFTADNPYGLPGGAPQTDATPDASNKDANGGSGGGSNDASPSGDASGSASQQADPSRN